MESLGSSSSANSCRIAESSSRASVASKRRLFAFAMETRLARVVQQVEQLFVPTSNQLALLVRLRAAVQLLHRLFEGVAVPSQPGAQNRSCPADPAAAVDEDRA